jgi:hypothetical protein
MTDEDRPEDSEFSQEDDTGGPLDILRRGFDALIAGDGARLPREAVSRVAQGTERTKREVVRIIGAEVRTFLEHVDAPGVLSQALERLEMDVALKVGFRRRGDGALKPVVEVTEKTVTHQARETEGVDDPEGELVDEPEVS